MKIFITVGTQPQPFNRLFKEVNKLTNKYSFTCQTGSSNVVLTNCDAFSYTKDLDQYIDNADLIITHAGVGSIMKCLKNNKKFIVVPRLSSFSEHVDDHQLEMAKYVCDNNYCAVVYNIEELEEFILNEIKIDRAKFISNQDYFNLKLNEMLKGE